MKVKFSYENMFFGNCASLCLPSLSLPSIHSLAPATSKNTKLTVSGVKAGLSSSYDYRYASCYEMSLSI